MTITLSLKDLLLVLIFIALIVLICYLIIFFKNMITTIKETNKILEDTKVVTGIAADKAVEIDGMVGDITSTVTSLTDLLKGNQSVVAAFSNLVNAVGSLATIVKKKNNKEDK